MSMRRLIRPISGAAASFAVTGIVLLLTPLFVANVAADQPQSSSCLGTLATPSAPCSPDIATKASLDASDAEAALKAIHLGLTEVGDGSTFVWHRAHGRLRGTVRPTSSFRDVDGRVCRHLVVTLAAGRYARTSEGIACRLEDGSWALEG
jgi:hypothetical protein